MHNRSNRIWAIPVIFVFAIGMYYVPPVHSRLAWRLESLRTQIKYLINPPDEAVFQPGGQTQIDIAVTQMMQTLEATLTPQASASISATSTPQPGPTLKPTITT